MAIADTTPDKILASVAERLRTIGEFGRDGVYLAEDVAPVPFPRNELFIAITPGNGSFNEDAYAGGGEEQAQCDFPITVTVWERIRVDKAGEAERVLTDPKRGMYRHARKIYQALLQASAANNSYEPEEGQDTLVHDQLVPLLIFSPVRLPAGNNNYWAMDLTFSARFDWDL